MKDKLKKKVFVGMSGGVDSSVSALLLKKEGYDVVGVFIKTWHPDFLPCNEEEERRDAMRVAAHLDIPFLTFDLEEVYKKEVADYMINEYKNGRTPNPDVMCNRKVKFGSFLDKAVSMGADFIATGHYAIVEKNKEGFFLKKGKDEAKDQSYFLWTLTQEDLQKTLFPVGHLNKKEVRVLAKKFKLPVAEKKDSQGICFLGEVDIKEFLKHYIKEEKGKVLNEKGEEIGHHDGALFYTLGERHGFVIEKKSPNENKYYVVNKDINKNTLTVSNNPKYSDKNNQLKILENTSWVNGVPKMEKGYKAVIRYHGESHDAKIQPLENNRVKVLFKDSVVVSPGQSCVFYQKDVLLGGGVVA